MRNTMKYLSMFLMIGIFIAAFGCSNSGSETQEKTTEPDLQTKTGQDQISAPVEVTTPVNTPTPEPSAAETNTPENTIIEYSLTDIAPHSDKTSCWMAIDGKVYDVTDSIDSHPGGDAILKGCGKEASELFSKHSQKARERLTNSYIGELK